MRLTGRVIRVDRAAQRVECVTAGSNGTVRVPYPDLNRPPPPLSTVLLEQTASGQWSVGEVASPRQQLLHDDFGTAIDGAVGGFFGDTNWRLTNLISYNYGQTPLDTGQGVANLNHSNGEAQNIAKDVNALSVTVDPAVWLSARIGSSTLGAAIIQCGLGAADDRINLHAVSVLDAQACFRFTAADPSAKIATAAGVSATDTFIPFVPTDSQFFDLDIVVVADGAAAGFVAMWVNGDGPYVTRATIPPVGVFFEPFFGVASGTGVAVDIFIDWMHCETVRGVTNPSRLYDLSPSGG